MSVPTEFSAAIAITRRQAPNTDRLRRYRVLVDGYPVTALASGETQTVPVRAGTHTVQMRIDWATSEPLTIEVPEGRTAELECRGRNPLAALYWVTFGRKRYIRLDVVARGGQSLAA